MANSFYMKESNCVKSSIFKQIKLCFVGYTNESFGNGLGPTDHPASEKLDKTVITENPPKNDYIA